MKHDKPGLHPDSIDTDGYDLRTAEGYAAWRADGGRWVDELDDDRAEADRLDAAAWLSAREVAA